MWCYVDRYKCSGIFGGTHWLHFQAEERQVCSGVGRAWKKGLFFHSEDKDSTFLRNVAELLPGCTTVLLIARNLFINCIWKDLGFSLGRGSGYPHAFCCLPRSFQVNAGLVRWNRSRPFPFSLFVIILNIYSTHFLPNNRCIWYKYIKQLWGHEGAYLIEHYATHRTSPPSVSRMSRKCGSLDSLALQIIHGVFLSQPSPFLALIRRLPIPKTGLHSIPSSYRVRLASRSSTLHFRLDYSASTTSSTSDCVIL
jgi:hypothetical protein